MKLSVSTGLFDDLPVEQAIRHLASMGWRHIEFGSAHLAQLPENGWKIRLNALHDQCRYLNVKAWQMHAPRFRNGRKIAVQNDIDVACRWLEYGAALGVAHIVFHAIGTTQDMSGTAKERIIERNVRAFRLVGRRAGELGVRAVIENMATFTVNRVSDIRRIIQEADAPALGICLDMGHAIKAGCDPAREVMNAGDLLWATHVHDNNGKDDQHRLPYHVDVRENPADWVKVVQALKKIGYRNAFNLEIHGEGIHAPLFVRDLKLAHAKKLFRRLMSC